MIDIYYLIDVIIKIEEMLKIIEKKSYLTNLKYEQVICWSNCSLISCNEEENISIEQCFSLVVRKYRS